ncbi:FxSxx-COOH cyclophane-containing RiPP peptide [Salinispora arenicola]|uniref:FxSxx-COOH cyclophane-containing RiPP peptide n=1 Tax=Salinispora arenicola TaxID=168697 RepID=UPI000363184F|nr:FxSxx-COOH cyclophane-containing RiPP peptide [Salinispora arenicola]MCN0150963.1 FxSxx-COOH protein [Salinispora arenicola]MCN0179143.1 FxSxx-COOH protein [Salinispora arenicola]NIL42228.1 FXSXX-COOH protein [Salinispora arenicola]NIL58540.1 FXSXX-COOH protein [Salinispora arenicola]NIL60926.1 FXSXX-COOH protein [Salinispora arenicola]
MADVNHKSDGGTHVDRNPGRSLVTAPLADLRHTPLGKIPLSRARAVALPDTRIVDQPTRVDVAAFGSSI